MDKELRQARSAHFKRTGHVAIVGNNFIECPDCKKHAHLDKGTLYAHGGIKNPAPYRIIDPSAF